MNYQRDFLLECAKRTPIQEPFWKSLVGALALVGLFIVLNFGG